MPLAVTACASTGPREAQSFESGDAASAGVDVASADGASPADRAHGSDRSPAAEAALEDDPAAPERPCSLFVAKDGSDRSTGTERDPFLTLQKAANVVKAGDTVCVRSGSYTGFSSTRRLKGSAASPIVFRPFGDEPVVLDGAQRQGHIINLDDCGAYLTIEGFELTNSRFDTKSTAAQNGIKCVCSQRAANDPADCVDWGGPLTLRNLHVHHVNSRGIQITVDGATVVGNRIEHLGNVGGIGLWLDGHKHRVAGNVIHQVGGRGINAANPFDDSLIERNTIYDTMAGIADDGPALYLWSGGNNILRNNLIYGANLRGILLSGTRNDTIYNNTIVGVKNEGITTEASSDLVRNNIVTGGGRAIVGAKGDHNLTDQDPMFVDVANHDFHLRKESPAVDKGASLPQVPDDFDGHLRPAGPAYDIGAFELP